MDLTTAAFADTATEIIDPSLEVDALEAAEGDWHSRLVEGIPGPTALVAAAADAGGVDALRDIPPVALAARPLDGVDLESDEALLRPVIEVSPVVNPLLAAVLEMAGCTRIGARSFQLHVGKHSVPSDLEVVLEALPLNTTYPTRRGKDGNRKALQEITRTQIKSQMFGEIQNTKAFDDLPFTARLKQDSYRMVQRPMGDRHPTEGPLGPAGVLISAPSGSGKLHVKVVTSPLDGNGNLFLAPATPSLHVMRAGTVLDPKAMTADQAVACALAARERGMIVIDPYGEIYRLEQRVSERVTALRVPGSPNLARLVVGSDAAARIAGVLPASDPDRADDAAIVWTLHAEHAVRCVHAAQAEGVPVTLDADASDILALTAAQPSDDKVLKAHQRLFVGRYAASGIGIVNASSVGAGKTIMCLRSLLAKDRQRQDGEPRRRSLVVLPAKLRAKWVRECRRWYRTANYVALQRKDLIEGRLDEVLVDGDATDRPTIVIVSFEAARDCADTLAAVEWDDLIVDEAHKVLANTSSTADALWRIRGSATMASPLTGTPVVRTLDNLGRLIAFARADHDMFHGKRLTERFDVLSDEGLEDMWRHVGPVVYRVDQSEFADEVPTWHTEVVPMTVTQPELDLSVGALHHLGDLFDELDRTVEALIDSDPSDADVARLKAERERMSGARLGAVTLARIAPVDPVGVAESGSAGAELLDDAGLVEPAVEAGPTKRAALCAYVAQRVVEGHAIIAFTEFRGTAIRFCEDLREAGVRAAVFLGGITDRRRDELTDLFQGCPCHEHLDQAHPVDGCPDCQQPQIDVMVCSSSAEEGLDFYRADEVLHLDLPWVPARLVQRIGRAARIGSVHDVVQSTIPVVTGTLETRVVTRLMGRAVVSMRALDAARGVDLSRTEVGMAIAGLHEAVPEGERDDTDERVFDFARDLAREAAALAAAA